MQRLASLRGARAWSLHFAGARVARLLSTGDAAASAKVTPPKGPVSWATLALTVAVGSGVVVYYNVARERRIKEAAASVQTFGKAQLGGPWSLMDSNGTPVSSVDLHGKYLLLYFGFTFCPDICPNELVKMSRVTDAMDAKPEFAGKVVPVFITLDPRRDTCEQVGRYVRGFHPKMIGLTGTPAQLAAAAKAYRVYYTEVDHTEEDDDYLVDHSIVIYLVGPDGEFMDFFTQIMTASDVTTKLERLVAEDDARRNPPPEGALTRLWKSLA